ncbi:MlaC/ttg2D family ABC transporter substrate-binding protein [Solilutibacter silvestris]|uniref:ABC-type transport protein n=1 Tax=Solilutibacter silvestris TaxID=1645665 RepID=A0A2K1Q163_9GAMM|nr:ABC transporter substrate-binding protein [Lysobacter silvestris]PNS08788.1 ABC-type transport protein [Lysobacter silvestris]
MNRSLLALSLTAALAIAVPVAASAQQNVVAHAQLGVPSQMVLTNSQRIITTLEKRRAEFTKNRAALSSFVNSEFNQMFDRDYAARLVLGRHARGAAPADVAAFSTALGDNLMQRYGSSLLDFNTRLTPRVKSESALPNNVGVRVNSELLRGGGDPVPVTYFMHQVNGQWKVFDVQVEGVSFVQTFRNQFDAPLSQKGIKAVAQDLANGQIQASTK